MAAALCISQHRGHRHIAVVENPTLAKGAECFRKGWLLRAEVDAMDVHAPFSLSLMPLSPGDHLKDPEVSQYLNHVMSHDCKQEPERVTNPK